MAESRIDLPEDLPPMAAGVVGYMAYDTIRLVENLPAENEGGLGLLWGSDRSPGEPR